MQRMLFAGVLGAVLLSLGVVQKSSLESRLDSLERAAPARDGALASEVERLIGELSSLRAELDAARGDDQVATQLDARIAAVGTALGDAMQLLEIQDERLGQVGEQMTALQGASATEDRLTALERGVELRWNGLSQTMEATAQLAREARARAESAGPSPAERWERTLGPTVQLAGETTVGSGVLLESRPLTDGTFETLLLTCWHVVRDIQADGRGPDSPIPVSIYAPDGSKLERQARVIGANVDIDACLLRLESVESVPHGAWLPSRARLAHSSVYDAIVAVGCPLGNDPIPTLGNVSSMHHEVDGNRFWMISAPTYIGNSGGGIFGAADHRLLGLFSKIYTHGSIRPIIVPHMGLVTPLAEVYDWLEARDLARIEERPDGTVQLVPLE
jgi:hypothetical protein